jgi:hypothetical protein
MRFCSPRLLSLRAIRESAVICRYCLVFAFAVRFIDFNLLSKAADKIGASSWGMSTETSSCRPADTGWTAVSTEGASVMGYCGCSRVEYQARGLPKHRFHIPTRWLYVYPLTLAMARKLHPTEQHPSGQFDGIMCEDWWYMRRCVKIVLTFTRLIDRYHSKTYWTRSVMEATFTPKICILDVTPL